MLKLNESLNKKNDSDRFNYLLSTNCIPSQLKYGKSGESKILIC